MVSQPDLAVDFCMFGGGPYGPPLFIFPQLMNYDRRMCDTYRNRA
jgi:hypothetical protein